MGVSENRGWHWHCPCCLALLPCAAPMLHSTTLVLLHPFLPRSPTSDNLRAHSSHPQHFGDDKEVRTARLSSLPCSPAVLLPAARCCASHLLPPCLEAFKSGWRTCVKMHGLGTAANTEWNRGERRKRNKQTE